jgi:SEC-C motif-containing protein
MTQSDQPCPCDLSKCYTGCCGRYIDGGIAAPTAEQLMRSRYTAYTLGREDYLLATWHQSTRPAGLGLAGQPAGKWLGLEVRRHVPDPLNPDRATVEFVARHKIGGRAHRLHETSRFVREDGRWFYVDGDLS